MPIHFSEEGKKKATTLSIKCQKDFSLTIESLDRTQEILQLEKKG